MGTRKLGKGGGKPVRGPKETMGISLIENDKQRLQKKKGNGIHQRGRSAQYEDDSREKEAGKK